MAFRPRPRRAPSTPRAAISTRANFELRCAFRNNDFGCGLGGATRALVESMGNSLCPPRITDDDVVAVRAEAYREARQLLEADSV